MKQRNYGLDLLRMLLMLMVVILHVLGKGGILDNAVMGTTNYYIAWILEAACYCAVNCYALITGYVYYNGKYRVSSMLMIGIQALFYNIIIYGIFWIASLETFSLGQLLNVFFPVSRNTHWYLSAYAGLFIMIPVLNAALNAFSLRQTKIFLMLSFVGLSLITTFLMEDPFRLAGGYSSFWLCYLYLVGGFIKKYRWDVAVSKIKCGLVFMVCVGLTVLFKFLVKAITMHLFGDDKGSGILLSYMSPTILFAGIALFLIFVQIKPTKHICKLVGIFSPAAFGVYLIHCHPYIFELMGNHFAFMLQWNSVLMLFGVIGIAIGIFVPCLLIDYLRLKLFQKLRIRSFLDRLENKLIPLDLSETTN